MFYYLNESKLISLTFRMQVVDLYQTITAAQPLNLPQHIKVWSNQKKLEWLIQHVQPVVDLIYIPFEKPSQNTIPVEVQIGQLRFQLQFPANMQGKDHSIEINGIEYIIPVPAVPQPQKVLDELYNYSLSYLRVMMDFMVFDRIIHDGDVDRVAPLLKRLIPTFIGLTSYKSKYAVECVNFITKTEWALSERDSIEVKLRSFVNTHGKAGHNKAADMQQENNIKSVKTVLKGLGAGKTEAAMVRSSLAAPIIDKTVEMFRKSLGLKPSSSPFEHRKKPDDGDRDVVSELLIDAKPFVITEGRVIGFDCEESVLTSLDKFKINEFMKRNGARAMNQCIFDDEDED